ncbi:MULTISPECIES: AraC family transcriptional regulator [unclassified Geodermatophilus]
MDRLVRYAALTGFPEVARSCGLDPERSMAGVGLDIGGLAMQDEWIPAVRVARLLESAAAESGREDFGVRMAGMRRLSTLGPISVVLREEPDLRSALDLLIRYEHVFNPILDLRLVEHDGLATVQTWLEIGEPVPARQALDLTVAGLVGVVRALIGADWQPLTTCFAHRAPADRGPFHEVFGPGLRFEQAFTGVVFPARDLDAATVTSDPVLRPYTQPLLESIASPRAATAVDQVRALVDLTLPLGRCSMTQISRTLGVQPRTVHRHLAEAGETFTGIVQATRARHAERHLANDGYSLTEVSRLLGFAAPSTFSTWFRRQFGTTASEWRSRSRADATSGSRG